MRYIERYVISNNVNIGQVMQSEVWGYVWLGYIMLWLLQIV